MRNKLKQMLEAADQTHLIGDLDRQEDSLLKPLFDQISGWPEHDLLEQKRSWQKRETPVHFEPLPSCIHASEQRLLESPQMGVIILAGGQGSRLGTNEPKGCFPILGKSLFERHIEKIRSKSGPVAVMTSFVNHHETVEFFQKNNFFGLPDIRFFSQGTLPLFDETGRWFWEKAGRIAAGSDGNGSLFSSLDRSGLMEYFDQRLIQIIPVDNPLAEPFDPLFASFHTDMKADLSIKCIRLDDPEEPTGRLVLKDGKLAIVEFAEINAEQKRQNLWANTGLLSFDAALMNQLSKQKFPLHWANRSSEYLENGKSIRKMAWKAERFIVDALLFTDRAQAIAYPRETCFAPLKDKNSIASIESFLRKGFHV